MKNMTLDNEVVLSSDCYTIEVPVKLHERVRVSGYVRTSKDENKDGAVIIFDLGDYQISEEILKSHGLKQSKIGIYKYLPVGNKFDIWTADLFIPIKIDSLKISFRTWKNNDDIVLGKYLDISKDYAYSKMYKELVSLKESN